MGLFGVNLWSNMVGMGFGWFCGWFGCASFPVWGGVGVSWWFWRFSVSRF